jgi:hypothetical protein
MKRIKSRGIMLFTATILLLLIGACSSTDNPVTPETPLKPPSNLMAYSKDKDQVGLTWTTSTDESATNFGSYQLRVKTGGTVVGGSYYPAKGSVSYTITGLTEGTIYDFVLSTKTSSGTVGDSVVVKWAPASRIVGDQSGKALQLYEWQSSKPSGLDLKNSAGYAEMVSMAGTLKTQADVLFGYPYVNDKVDLGIENPAVESASLKSTKISTVTYNTNTLDDPKTAPPGTETYTKDVLEIEKTTVSTGRIVFLKTQEGNYVRVLITNKNGFMIQGTSPDRYLEVLVSYQSVTGVPYAKTVK